MPDSTASTQLDRIEAGLGDLRADIAHLGERLARIEERHTGMSARIDMHGATLERHAERLGEVEKSLVRADQSTGILNGRWGAMGSIGLVSLGSGLSIIGYILVQLVQ